eukprot:TRINITY_DN7880_c0_g1_i1.p1 TRINITY_DN7880_c0_g1~~TRINITY_DN7880_c0_g1_i1.p1  ORF type:complete len:841 (+),score=148.47 TRINITY_DN7880_c0_g1_i1:819-3341(+)
MGAGPSNLKTVKPPTSAPLPVPDGLAGVREIRYEDIKFEDDSLLGSGGAGAVRKGEWNCIQVAVKTLHIPDATEFLNELRILSSVGRHPYIVELVGACTKPPLMAIVTQFMERGSLADLIENKQKQLDMELILLMAKDICKGMIHIHSMNLIHRDLKSSNLLVASDSRVESEARIKITDFGISKEQSLNMTKFVGTPLYMAPEMYEDPSRYTTAVDIYAFGLILWELLTRKKPFHEVKSSFELERVVREGGRPTIPPEVPPILSQLIRSCWDADPRVRPTFKSALETLDMIYQQRANFSKWKPASTGTIRFGAHKGDEQPSITQMFHTGTNGSMSPGNPPRLPTTIPQRSNSANSIPSGPNQPPVHRNTGPINPPRTLSSSTQSQSNPAYHFSPATTHNPSASPSFIAGPSPSRGIAPQTLVRNIESLIPSLEASRIGMVELRQTLIRCSKVLEFGDRLSMEDFAEFSSYIGHLHDSANLILKKSDAMKYIQQPIVHRQLEQIYSILQRMTSTYQQTYLKNTYGFSFPPCNANKEFLDQDAWNMWRYYAGPEALYMDWDEFVNSVQQFAASLASPIALDDAAREELRSLLDPALCGSVSVYKFAALTNLTQPFANCLSNILSLRRCFYFHGYVSLGDAELLLKGKAPGTYLLHIADPNPFRLCLQYVSPASTIMYEMIPCFSMNLVSPLEIKRIFPNCSNPYSQEISWDGSFFGSINYEDTQELLTGQRTGTYLIRLSQSTPGSFVIGYVSGEGKVHQVKVDWQGSQFSMNNKNYANLKTAILGYRQTFSIPSCLSKHQNNIQSIITRLRAMLQEVPMENHYQDISKALESHYSSIPPPS